MSQLITVKLLLKYSHCVQDSVIPRKKVSIIIVGQMDIHSECNNSPTSRMEVKKNINTCNNALKMS